MRSCSLLVRNGICNGLDSRSDGTVGFTPPDSILETAKMVVTGGKITPPDLCVHGSYTSRSLYTIHIWFSV